MAITRTAKQSGAAEVLRWCEAQREAMLETLRHMVEMESPSFNKPLVDRLGKWLAEEFERRGGKATLHRQKDFGDHLQVDFAGGPGKPIMLLGHFDTVWEAGMLRSMPFRVAEGRAWGPGTYDMKAGITSMMYAIAALREARGEMPRPVTILLNTDEEVGSESSRPITESLAKKSAAVLVMEPSQGLKGAAKTSRKGVGDYLVRVHGKSAHAGVDFDKGVSATLELARQIAQIAKFTDLKRGVTVNVGVIRGGTRSNVFAEIAEAEVDVRIVKAADARYLEKKFRGLKPFNKKCRLEISGGVNRPPLERSEKVVRLYKLAAGSAEQMGFALSEAATGGGSDGNFTAALGIPTLDGLGAVGEGAHARHESIFLAEWPRRTALLAALLETI